MNKILGLDLDGVLYKWHMAIYEHYRLYKDYTDTFDTFWTTFYLTITQGEWDVLTNIDFLYACIPPDLDCVNFIDNVKDRFDIYYVTNRPLYVKTTTEQFLNRHKFPFYDNLVFTDDKVNIVRLLQIDYFIEDRVEILAKLSKVTNVIMMAQPYNKSSWGIYPTSHSLMGTLQYLED